MSFTYSISTWRLLVFDRSCCMFVVVFYGNLNLKMIVYFKIWFYLDKLISFHHSTHTYIWEHSFCVACRAEQFTLKGSLYLVSVCHTSYLKTWKKYIFTTLTLCDYGGVPSSQSLDFVKMEKGWIWYFAHTWRLAL